MSRVKKSLSTTQRSHCPVCAALDIFGDRWSLLIVRDIMIFGKTTYGEFLKSPEHISTNILAVRLSLLQDVDIVKKTQDPNDKRKEHYSLTKKGIDLLPMIAEMMLWSVTHNNDVHIPKHLVSALTNNREQALRAMREQIEKGQPLV